MHPTTDTDLPFATIEEIARLFRKRKLSPVELTKLILARIEQLNPKLNAFITANIGSFGNLRRQENIF
jgi:aspartyl-tRNA(Asn)/glutamyl-tRNA(Gln) amidotransferase subunit A